jgi:hypothetical protein
VVYCTNCGTQNNDDAKYCTNCGRNLAVSLEERVERGVEEWGDGIGRQTKDECFGLPHGGVIAGLLIGIIIIIVGLSFVPGLIPPEIREATEPYFWAIIVIIFGILIVAGALYGLRRRR